MLEPGDADAAAQAEKIIAASGALGMPMLQHGEEILGFTAWYLERFGRPTRVLEIGSGYGGTTALWCEMVQGPGAQVVSVDIPLGVHPGGLSPQDALVRDARLKAAYQAFHAITADSQRAETFSLVAGVAGGPFDLLFIDGDHHYESIRNDFETYSPLVKKGHPVLLHDIMDTLYYRSLGINVARLWSELPGEKAEWVSRPNGDSGGLGAVIVKEPEDA